MTLGMSPHSSFSVFQYRARLVVVCQPYYSIYRIRQEAAMCTATNTRFFGCTSRDTNSMSFGLVCLRASCASHAKFREDQSNR